VWGVRPLYLPHRCYADLSHALDLATLSWLCSPTGTTLLAELAQHPLTETSLLPELERLRRRFPPPLAAAALELTMLRRRAAAKFPHAERLFFVREALEQASSAPVAAHRAARLLAYDRAVADLGCGIGGDTIACALAGAQVTAVDRDPLRLAICQANLQALGLEQQVTLLCRDLLVEPPPSAHLLFCDPGRRRGGERRFSPEAYEPPLSHVLGWRLTAPALALKLAPGIDPDLLPADAELEFVSLNGELKEASLWCGPLATTSRRATLLRTHLDGQITTDTLVSAAQLVEQVAHTTPPAAFLYEPDPAVIRAGLVRDLAHMLDAAQLDLQIAYLTAPEPTASPFVRVWPVLTWLPFSLKRLRAVLRELDAGPITVKKRGSPLDSDQLARQLSRSDGRPLVVVLTQSAGRPVAIICAPPLGR
jgi:hypothetical protein